MIQTSSHGKAILFLPADDGVELVTLPVTTDCARQYLKGMAADIKRRAHKRATRVAMMAFGLSKEEATRLINHLRSL
jgi:hypothetical protein